jgi:N-acetylmuramoyl-L-alanine amidase
MEYSEAGGAGFVMLRATDLVGVVVLALLSGAGIASGAERAPARVPDTAAFPVVTDTRIGGDLSQTRFVMDFSRKVELRAFTLADPYRVVIDLPQVVFKLPPRTGEAGRGLVRAFRYGLVMQGGSRIVLDVARPVRVDRAFMLEPVADQPARLVIDLVAIERATFMQALARPSPLERAATGAFEREPGQRGDPRPIVVLDPGHGGLDFGTVASTGVMEKSIVLDFAMVLRDRLEQSGKYRVVLTRAEDTFVPLADRVRMARIRQAALFISIHADALRRGEGEAKGATVYTLSETASDAEAARLAESENRADVIAGVDLSHEPGDVADILIDLAQRETKTFSVQFAKTLVADLRKVARMHKHPLKSAGFKVLKAPDVPSVLIELGYVSSKTDLKQLTSTAWQARAAGAIAQAVDNFFSTRIADDTAGRR